MSIQIHFTGGTLKFLSVAIVLLLLPACSGDKKDATWWDNEKEIIELECKIDLARYRVEAMATESTLAPSDPIPKDLAADIASLSKEKAILSMKIDDLESGWEAFRTEVLNRRRTKVIGKTFDTFKTSKGRIFNGVTISNIDNAGVSFRHKAGSARLGVDDLDVSNQVFFGLDNELASIAQEKETKQRQVYNRWVNQELAAAKIKKAKLAKARKKEEEEEEERLATARTLAASRSITRTSPLSASIGNLGDSGSSYGSRRYSSYGSYRRPRTTYYYPNTSSSYRPSWNVYSNTRAYVPVTPVRPSTPYQCPVTPSNP